MQENSAIVADVVRNVQGNIGLDACRILFNMVDDIPKDGVILDICSGYGRSTIVMAKALETWGKTEASIISVDSHITDPLSERAYEKGSLLPFLAHLRRFKVMSRVSPLLIGAHAISKILNKKSANLVVVQTPVVHSNFEAVLSLGIQQAQFAIRKDGRITVVCNNEADLASFERITDQLFDPKDFEFKTNTPFLRGYERK